MESKKDNNRKRKLIVLISLLLVVIVGMIVAIILIMSKPTEPEIDSRSFEEIFWNSETAEDAIEEFQKKIDATADPEQKAELYSERAEMLFILFSNERLYSKQILKDAENAYTANMENLKYLYQLNNYCTYFSEETKDSNCQKETPTLIKRKDIQ